MKNKLKIAARSGHNYIKFKVQPNAMQIIREIIEDCGSEYMEDDQVMPSTSASYSKWQDIRIPVQVKKKGLEFDIICGNKYIHMIIIKYKKIEDLNKTLNKYCEWVEPLKLTQKTI